MNTKNIHVIGIDPGGTTGWARFTIPRVCIFGDEEPSIVEWDYGVFQGPANEQVMAIARYARETQSLDYKCGPALVVEDWDPDPNFKVADKEVYSPIRIGAKLALLWHLSNPTIPGPNWLGDATLTFQGRVIAKTTYTDERLKNLKLYVANDHIRDATRHALTAIRRARQNPEFAEELWPY